MKRLLILLCNIFPLVLTGCGYIARAIFLRNNSTIVIAAVPGCTFYGSIDKGNYPDTLLPENGNNISFDRINKGDRAFLLGRSGNLDVVLDWFLPNDTLSIYVFDSDTLDVYNWNQIREGYKVAVRYDLTKEDIKKRTGEVIPFPPNKKMKRVHMYPPYEEVIAKYGKSE